MQHLLIVAAQKHGGTCLKTQRHRNTRVFQGKGDGFRLWLCGVGFRFRFCVLRPFLQKRPAARRGLVVDFALYAPVLAQKDAIRQRLKPIGPVIRNQKRDTALLYQTQQCQQTVNLRHVQSLSHIVQHDQLRALIHRPHNTQQQPVQMMQPACRACDIVAHGKVPQHLRGAQMHGTVVEQNLVVAAAPHQKKVFC